MKFWQLISIFNDEKQLLEMEFNTANGIHFQKNYHGIKEIILNKNRDILDSIVDKGLLKQICLKSKKKLYYSTEREILFSYQSGFADKVFSIREAIDLFDHNLIEEVFEKSEAYVGGNVGNVSD